MEDNNTYSEEMEGIRSEIKRGYVELKSIRDEIERMRFENGFQLKNPLDITSKKIIKNLLVFPVVEHLQGRNAQSASLYGTIFSADRTYVIDSIAESHGTAASNGTLQFIRLQNNETANSGDNLLSITFDLTASAGSARIRNVREGGFSTAQGVLIFSRGDRLGMKPSGTLASLEDLQITTYFKQV